MDERQENAHAYIRDGVIIIHCDVAGLSIIVEGAWAAGALHQRLKITDESAFARALVAEMNREDEDGSTVIHLMFDKAIHLASEAGADGIEEHEDREP